MPPRKAKGKKAATEPSVPRKSTRGAKAAAAAAEEVETPVAAPVEVDAPSEEPTNEALQAQMPPSVSEVAIAVESVLEGPSSSPKATPPQEDESMAVDEDEVAAESLPDIEMGALGSVTVVPTAPTLTREERQAKLEALRGRMQSASKANRDDVVTEHQKHLTSARDLVRLEKQRKLAAVLREKADAEERGEDTERKKNWEYTIEENDAWEKKMKRKIGRGDSNFNDDNDDARKKYKKDLDRLKPDLEAYTRQKEAALGLVPGALSKAGSSKNGGALVGTSSEASRLAAEDLYRDGTTLAYGDNKPSDDAIDRVVAKLNFDMEKKSKSRKKNQQDDGGDITYINESNKVFNKKIARYYDKYTKEIRDSFERGTAL